MNKYEMIKNLVEYNQELVQDIMKGDTLSMELFTDNVVFIKDLLNEINEEIIVSLTWYDKNKGTYPLIIKN